MVLFYFLSKSFTHILECNPLLPVSSVNVPTDFSNYTLDIQWCANTHSILESTPSGYHFSARFPTAFLHIFHVVFIISDPITFFLLESCAFIFPGFTSPNQLLLRGIHLLLSSLKKKQRVFSLPFFFYNCLTYKFKNFGAFADI